MEAVRFVVVIVVAAASARAYLFAESVKVTLFKGQTVMTS
jgi:hypothetical protein